MLTLRERTLSGRMVLAGVADPFLDVGDPYEVDADELAEFLRAFPRGFTFTRQDEHVLGRSANEVGVLTHQMLIGGAPPELDELLQRLTHLQC